MYYTIDQHSYIIFFLLASSAFITSQTYSCRDHFLLSGNFLLTKRISDKFTAKKNIPLPVFKKIIKYLHQLNDQDKIRLLKSISLHAINNLYYKNINTLNQCLYLYCPIYTEHIVHTSTNPSYNPSKDISIYIEKDKLYIDAWLNTTKHNIRVIPLINEKIPSIDPYTRIDWNKSGDTIIARSSFNPHEHIYIAVDLRSLIALKTALDHNVSCYAETIITYQRTKKITPQLTYLQQKHPELLQLFSQKTSGHTPCTIQ